MARLRSELGRWDSRSAEIAGGICGVAAPPGSGPDHDARAAFGESPAGGLLGGVVVAAERRVDLLACCAKRCGHGRLKMAWVPTRRQRTCGCPSLTEAPYSKVALPSGAQVSSHTSSYPAIFLTRRLLRNPLASRRSATNRTTARRNAAFWLGVSASKSLRNLASRSKVGNVRSGRPRRGRPAQRVRR